MQAIELTATVLFAIAITHTFLTSRFAHLAHSGSAHAGLWHFFGEIEAVFGIWAAVLVIVMMWQTGAASTVAWLEGLNFTEPMFVFAIMVIAGSRPIIKASGRAVAWLAGRLPLSSNLAVFLVVLIFVPLLGSLVTEPAAMTLAALILRERFYSKGISSRLKYATLGVLFVNISIGGTLTNFAAPPVLMVAGTWSWDSSFMLTTFGWKAALAVLINAVALTVVFRRELLALPVAPASSSKRVMPLWVVALHLLFLAGAVFFAHHPVVFLAILLLFLGFADAYKQFQDRLILREGLMVALFLAGLVVLGSLQRWWLQPLLADMHDLALFGGAMGLTALTDNAALTYLGSLVEGVDDAFKYSLVAGAVSGGGLTIIANAPNPAGVAMLKKHFADGAVSPLQLFVAALLPSAVAALSFLVL